ncbi:TSCPD domain-containing protein [Chachezhania sediminis]|uniref:TSCPD domain-containing protein n=1 Tax=Chachezhania sediminis TaxID=2599291 RepID=UPI00131B078C|nr:ribonucleotide reductase [Chachezhania sediminis]
MSTRNRLPNRRPSLTVSVDWQNHAFALTVGVDPRDGRLSEVFYADGQKSGTALQHTVQDACVIISVALQHGVPIADLTHSLGRVPGAMGVEGPASPVGAVAEALAALDAELGGD